MKDRPLSRERYARAIERRWAETTDRAVVLSPREWELINRWHEQGIPLDLVEEAMDAAAERRVRGGRARSLARLAPAVEEAWSVVRAGRIEPVATAPDAPSAADEPWPQLPEAVPGDSPLGRFLVALAARHAGGQDRVELEEELDLRLPELAPAGQVAGLRESIERELDAYRARMSPARFRATLDRALVARLRQELRLPRYHSGPL